MQERRYSICPFCGLGCGFYLTIANGEVTGIDYAMDHPFNEGALCSKGNTSFEVIQRHDRLFEPMKRIENEFSPASWEEALATIANRLREIKEKYGGKSIGIFASSKATNEENYLVQKFARKVLETDNVDNSIRLCHAATMLALRESFGLPYPTGPLEDLEHANCILIIGVNPFENAPVLARRILRAKEKGAKIIVVDPRRTRTSWHSDFYLPIYPGTDVQLIKAFIQTVFQSKLERREFLRDRAESLNDLERLVADSSPEIASSSTGIEPEYIRKVALTFALADKASIILGNGLTQHVNGTEAVGWVANLVLITGNIGRRGTGIFPLLDQCNMMGASDMGTLPEFYPGYVKAEQKGLTLIEMIEAAHSEQMKAIFIVGMNPMASFPNTSFVKEALTRLDLLVVQDIFMTETAKLAHFVLPTACWAETEGTFTSTGRRVQRLTRAMEPPGTALEGWRIIARLADQLGEGELFRYNSWEEIFKETVANVRSYEGLTVDDVSRIGGAIIPKDRAELYENRFETEKGRARLQYTTYATNIERESLPFTMITGKVLHHHGTGSMTRRISFAMQETGEPYLEISEEDLSALGLRNGDEVYVRSRLGEIRVKTKVAKIKTKVVFLPFHFPDLSPNNLIPINLDPASKTPELKGISVSISKAK